MVESAKTRKTRIGVVISNKMEKSIVVETVRLMKHKLYGKIVRRHVRYMADDPENSCNIGDRVLIEECRPLSKKKRWRMREIVERAAEI
ncbi:MAG: 30S ribosomal protein S17 [Deltaproteobacteria bacterium]